MAKANTAKTMEFKSEQGNVFVFQKVLPSKWLDILDDADATGSRMRKKLYPAVLENIIVQPGALKPDDFDQEPYNGFGELEEVVVNAIRFQSNKL